MLIVNWSEIKSFLDNRSLSCQYVELDSKYIIQGHDGNFILQCEINKNSSDITDFETNYKPTGNASIVTKTQNSAAAVPVSLRLEGMTFSAPANTTTTYWYKLPADYRIRGAEFQLNNSKFGDIIRVWLTDHDGVVYPVDTRLTPYVPKMYAYHHEPGTTAPVLDLVDDDTSDEVSSVFYLEFEYENNQTTGSDVEFIANFWMYEET